MKIILTLLIAALFGQLSLVAAPEKGSTVELDRSLEWGFTPDPSLPNVLILGDSISIGYTRQVRALLQGKANVYRPVSDKNGIRPANCGGTTRGVQAIERWLSVAEWDVIHYNWGLHDLKHIKKVGGKEIKSNDPNDPVQASLEVYCSNLEILTKTITATGALPIFATTTPVVPGTLDPLRLPEDPIRYNEAAIEIMKQHEVRVNDLHAYCLPHLDEWQLPKNVHFKPEGSAGLAKQVAAVIESALAEL